LLVQLSHACRRHCGWPSAQARLQPSANAVEYDADQHKTIKIQVHKVDALFAQCNTVAAKQAMPYRCTARSCRFGEAFDYISTDDAEQCYNAAELDNPSCPYISSLYQGGALTALEKSFVQACIAEDPAQRWTAEQLLAHPYLAQ
jgi:hypothetical protein